MVRVPLRVPVWLGVNTTSITQLELAARLVPLHASLETLKSPEAEALLTCTAKLLVLLSVTLFAAEVVPTSCWAKTIVTGLTVNFPGAADAVAVGVGASVEVAVAVGVSVRTTVGVAVMVAVGVGVSVAVAVGVAVAVSVAVAVGVGVAGSRNWAASTSPFSSIKAEFLPDAEGSPTFRLIAASSAPSAPHPLAPGTANVVSATWRPVVISAFPPGPPLLICGWLLGVSTRFKTMGSLFDPMKQLEPSTELLS